MGAGNWDPKGGGTTKYIAKGDTVQFPELIQSGGGNFKVTVYRNSNDAHLMIYLYESDDGGETGTLVEGKGITGTGDVIFYDLNTWKDGTNEQAEFFVKVYAYDKYTNVTLYYYD